MTGPRIYISVDMEGVAGVTKLENANPDHATYSRGQVLMVEEANAAARGAFDAGAHEVIVSDSHGPMDNLPPDLLDRRVRLVNGSPRTCGMVEGLTEEFDAVFFVGYHAAANRPGVLAHSFSGVWSDLRLNGSTVSEADVNALFAAERGVPVKLLSGDDQICAAGAGGVDRLKTAEVKRFVTTYSAESLSPAAAREVIYEAAAHATTDSTIRPAAVPASLCLDIDMKSAAFVDLVQMVPTVERLSELTLRIECETVTDIYKFITVASTLAGQVNAMQSHLVRGF